MQIINTWDFQNFHVLICIYFILYFIHGQMRFTSQWTRFHLRFIVVHISEGEIRVNAAHDHTNHLRNTKKHPRRLNKNLTNSWNFVKKLQTQQWTIYLLRDKKINPLRSVPFYDMLSFQVVLRHNMWEPQILMLIL